MWVVLIGVVLKVASGIEVRRLSEEAVVEQYVNLKLRRGAAETVVERVAMTIGENAGSWKRLYRESKKFEEKHKAADLDLWYVLEIVGEVQEALKHLVTSHFSDEIELIEAVPMKQLSYFPDDPHLGSQEHHYESIYLEEAWELSTGEAEVVVAVLDTGTDLRHVDLIQNVWRNQLEICGDGIDNDADGYVDNCYGYNFADDSGIDLYGASEHGTHCAGIIAASTDNGIGIAGIAGGRKHKKGISLMTLVIFGATGMVSSAAEAIVYAADHGARIISNSWGYTSPQVYTVSELRAIDYAVRAGCIVLFAAGNANSDDHWYPAFYDAVIAVGAVDTRQSDAIPSKAKYSNHGEWIDIAAPGTDVYSTVRNNQYENSSGTSMATPHIAGVLALGFSVNPHLSSDLALACLKNTAQPISTQVYLGAGLVHARDFLLCAQANTAAPSSFFMLDDPSCDFDTGDHLCPGWRTGVNGLSFFNEIDATTSAFTGPSSSDGHFVYTEASFDFNQDFDLVSPYLRTLPNKTFRLRFQYHMYGWNIGSLRLDYTQERLLSQQEATWMTLWSKSGQQSSDWLRATITIPGTASHIRFYATTGGSFRSDIAIDTIEFLDLPDPSDFSPTSQPILLPTTIEPTVVPSALTIKTYKQAPTYLLGSQTCRPSCKVMTVDGQKESKGTSICGDFADGYLNDTKIEFIDAAVAGTRCCSIAGDEADLSLCPLEGNCEAVDYLTAKNRCDALEGYRLCTADEILNEGRALDSGCNYNYMHVWTSSNFECSDNCQCPLRVDGRPRKDSRRCSPTYQDLDKPNLLLGLAESHLAGIRCCDIDGIRSNDKSFCSKKCEAVTYYTALSTCESHGMRLCTADEILLEGRAARTGCSYDWMHVWAGSSTMCCAMTVDGNLLRDKNTCGPSFADRGQKNFQAEYPEEDVAGTRCCSDFPESENDISVCAYKCEAVDLYTATSRCEERQLRLCTAAEIAAGRAAGTGCSYDNMRVWTSDPADCFS